MFKEINQNQIAFWYTLCSQEWQTIGRSWWRCSRVRNLRVIIFVPDRYLRFIGGINMHAPSIGVICISMESTHMELSLGDIMRKVCWSFKWNFWQWKLQKRLVPNLFVGQQLFIYQIEEQSLLSLLAKNWVNPWNLHLLLHNFPNHVCSDLLWKLDHGSAEPWLAGHRRIKVLFFTPTHTQSRHTRLKMKDQSLFRRLISPQAMWFSSYSL